MYCPHFAAFCAHYGIVGDHDVFHHINANLRCQPTSQAHARRWAARFAELQSLRNVSERMFVTALVTGESRLPTHLERLAAQADGHEDLAATHAARRVLAKRAQRGAP
jgi:hypothetical protein